MSDGPHPHIRERDVAILHAAGLNAKQCAQRLRISPNTVYELPHAAYRRLGMKSRRAR